MLATKRLLRRANGLAALALVMLCAFPSHGQSADLFGIAHVAFRVNDLEKAREFYLRLGFEQAFEFAEAGKTSVAFIKVNDRQFIELYPRTGDSQLNGLMHICFEATDIESVRCAETRRGTFPAVHRCRKEEHHAITFFSP